MATAEGGVDGEERARLVARLVELRARGELSRATVAQAARSANVTSRTVWRWVAAGQPSASGGSRAHRLTELEREAVWACGGNVAAARRLLVGEGADPPAARTLERAWRRETTPAQRAYAREGSAAARGHAVYLRHEAEYRAAVYEADHKELAIEVLGPRAQRPVRPWVTMVVDQFSRLIVGWAVSLRPTAAEVLAALRMAVVVDPARGAFGGVPGGLRFDGGLEFAARAIEDAALALGCMAVPTAPYSPWQKGKIERLNRTIDQELLCGMPRWTGGPRGYDGRLLDDQTPLTLRALVAAFAQWVQAYNTQRPHGAVGGVPPAQAWAQDATPVRSLAPEQVRWMLLAGAQRTVNKDGVHFAGHIYVAAALNGLVGERVEVRYMPHDPRQIEVYRQGRWLTTACPQAQLSAAERDAVLERRARDARDLDKQARRARRRARVRYAPLTAAQEPEPTTVLSGPTAQETDRLERARRERDALVALGLTGDLNRPRLTVLDGGDEAS